MKTNSSTSIWETVYICYHMEPKGDHKPIIHKETLSHWQKRTALDPKFRQQK